MSSSHNILGVPLNASKAEIKRAYYRKARLLHPDVNKSPNAEEEFIRLNMAYEALTNPKFKTIKITPPKKQTASHKTAAEIRREEIKKRREELRKEALKRAKINRQKLIRQEKRNTLSYKYFKIVFMIFIQLSFFLPTLLIVFDVNFNVTIEREPDKRNGFLLILILFLIINIGMIIGYYILIKQIRETKKSLKQT